MVLSGAESGEDIFDAARVCLDLFKSYLAERRPAALKIEAEQQRFWAWSNGLKVFARPHIRLDAQLHNAKYAEIKRMVLLLLNVLGKNLSLALDSSLAKGRDDSKWITDEHTGQVKQDGSDPFAVALFGIDGSLKRLQRISDVILQATQDSLTRRISAYAEKYRDKDFEHHVDRTIQWRFPHIPKSLHRVLVETALHRHYRILYDRDHRDQGAPTLQLGPKPAATQPSRTKVDAKAQDAGKEKQNRDTPEATSRPLDTLTVSEPQSGPLTIDEDMVKAKIEEQSSAPTESRVRPPVSETGAAFYPPAPAVAEGQKTAKCNLCLKEFPAEEFERRQWEIHVDRDLQPYVCISEDCSKNYRFFDNMHSWIAHMKKTHTPLWIRYLHNEISCPLCVAEASVDYEDERDFAAHMSTAHDAVDVSLAANSGIPRLRPVNLCPVCGDQHLRRSLRVDEEAVEIKDETPLHKENLVSKASGRPEVRFSLPGDDAEDAKVPGQARPRASVEASKEEKDHERIEKNIGKHLQALAFYFSKWLVDENDTEQASVERSHEVSSADWEGLPKLEYDDSSPPTGNLGSIDAATVVQIAREELDLMFPDSYYRTDHGPWRGMGSTDALTLTAIIFLGLELYSRFLELDAVPIGPPAAQFNKFRKEILELLRPFLLFTGSDSDRSDYIAAIIAHGDQSRRLLEAWEALDFKSGRLPPSMAGELSRINRIRQTLRFKFGLALLSSNVEAVTIPDELLVKHYKGPLRTIMVEMKQAPGPLLDIVREEANGIWNDSIAKIQPTDLVGSESESSDDETTSLKENILDATWANNQHQIFLPADMIDKLSTPAIVQSELEDEDVPIRPELIQFASGPGKRVFLTLVFVENIAALPSLYSAGFSDADLPIGWDGRFPNTKTGFVSVSTLDPRTNAPNSLKVTPFSVQDWKPLSLLRFAKDQWIFLAPIFTEEKFRYTFYPKQPLPFVPFLRGEDNDKDGFFSRISQIRVHSAHREDLKAPAFLALKQIPSDKSQFFEREAGVMGVIRSFDHEHISKPIAIYEQGDCVNYLSPWAADGNLRDTWARIDSNAGARPGRGPVQVAWALQEMQGIADGIEALHKRNCYHGDLKPENLLTFYDGSSLGRLKIADIGVAKEYFSSVSSRATRTLAMTGTFRYEPPEYDQRGGAFFPSYDIWSLGCIFLEFLIWLLEGKVELDKFNFQREFRYFWEMPGLGKYRIHSLVRSKIYDMEIRLRPGSTRRDTALSDVLAVVANEMLNVNARKDSDTTSGCRITATELVRHLDRICERALSDPDYLFDASVWERRVALTAPEPSALLQVPARHDEPRRPLHFPGQKAAAVDVQDFGGRITVTGPTRLDQAASASPNITIKVDSYPD